MSVHSSIRRERTLRGWSQEQLAEMLGVSTRTVIRWEQGSAIPYPYHRELLSQCFGKSIQELGFLSESDDIATRENLLLSTKSGIISEQHPLIDSELHGILSQNGGLIGRYELLQQMKMYLLTGESSLASLYGLPGIGKTALAVSIATEPEVRQHFHNGILWVGLGPQPDILSLMARWGTLLGVTPYDVEDAKSIRAWGRALRASIGQRYLLLVIDDAWSTKDALTFQIGGPNCAHLLTTRLPQVAFAFAQGKAQVVSELSETDGLALLARFVPHLRQEDEQSANALVHAVGGLPLALTLIGKYLAAHAFTGQRRRLQAAQERLLNIQQRLLVSAPLADHVKPPALVEETPISLQATIAVSEQLLSEPARAMLRSLAIFPAKPNSFSEEAALQVSQQSVEVLDELWDAGLLENRGVGRYTLHQTIADYVHLQGTDEAAQRSLAHYMHGFIQAHEQDHAAIELETTNIFVALDITITHEMQQILIESIIALMPFLRTCGLYIQADHYLQQALRVAETHDEQRQQMLLLSHLASIAELRGEYGQAESYGERGLVLARQMQHQRTICDLLSTLGSVAFLGGDLARAQQLYAEGLQLAEQLNDIVCMCKILLNLGIMSRSQGDFRQAEEHFQRTLVLARTHGYQEQVISSLSSLVLLARELGNYTLAEQYALEGLTLAHQYKHSNHLSQLLMGLAALKGAQGQYEQAFTYAQEALEVARRTDDQRRIIDLLTLLGSLAKKQHDYALAEMYLNEGLNLARQHGLEYIQAQLLPRLDELRSKQEKL